MTKKLRPGREITLFSVYNGVLSLSTVSAPPWGSRVAFRWLLEGGLSSSVLEPREGMLGICFLCALEWGGEEGTVLFPWRRLGLLAQDHSLPERTWLVLDLAFSSLRNGRDRSGLLGIQSTKMRPPPPPSTGHLHYLALNAPALSLQKCRVPWCLPPGQLIRTCKLLVLLNVQIIET